MTMISLVFIVSVAFFQSQARTVTAHAGRFDVQLNARFGLTSIERDLRTAGVGVVDAQPMIVEASSLAVTFNADLVARDTTEPGSVST